VSDLATKDAARKEASETWRSRRRHLERLVLDFLGAPSTGEAAGLFRIVFGLLSLWYALGVWVNLERYYANDGFVPWDLVKGDGWSWISAFAHAPESRALLTFHGVALFVASAGLLLGLGARIWTLVICYIHISLQFRDPFILNSGDRLFQIVAGIACVMPLDARWSLRSWWRARRGKAPIVGSVLGLRLLQMQIAYVYISSAIAKIANKRWQNGMALRDVLASPVFAEWPTYIDFRPLVWAMTYGTLLFEFAFPTLVWWKKARNWLLLAGIGFHVMIDALMVIPIFSAIMIVCYPVFLEDEEIRRFFARFSRRSREAAR
jgi:hypothetical protein